MHKCNELTNDLIELALKHQKLPAEIEKCSSCREGFISLRDALRATDGAMKLAQPAEAFWSGYRARLRNRLEGYIPPGDVRRADSRTGFARNFGPTRSRVSISWPI